MTYDVIIVGAGICGLTAALGLREQGIENILVLEAHDAPGGRARSITLSNGEAVSEGANWFHGGDDNPFYRWAKQRYTLPSTDLDDNGGAAAETLWRAGTQQDMGRLFDALDDAYACLDTPEQLTASLRDVAERVNDPKAIELIEFMAAGWMAMDRADQIAASEYFEDPLGPGGWQLAGGMGQLLDLMARDLGDDKIQCGAVVSNVEEIDDVVSLTLASGNIFVARQVVLTVSPAVLLSGSIQLPKPVEKAARGRIDGIQMGNLVKIIIPMKPEFFSERGIGLNTPIYMVDDHCFIHMRTAGAHTIAVFKGGAAGRDVERVEHGQIEEYSAELLDKINALIDWRQFRDGDITVTRWGSDPLTLGSYTVCAPGAHRPDPFTIGRISFAGEALLSSHDDSPGQMAGAWASGRKASELVVKTL